MIGSIFIVLESSEIPDIATVHTWGRAFVKNNLPGILEYSDHFPGGLIRFTGPLKVKNEHHAGLKISCVEPRVYKMLILSLNLKKETLKIQHLRILEKKDYTLKIHMTFKKGILTQLPFKETLLKKTTEAYNLLYAEKLNANDVREAFHIINTHTTLENMANKTLIKGSMDIQLSPDLIPEQTLQEFLYFIETHGIGLSKDKGYGNIRLYSS